MTCTNGDLGDVKDRRLRLQPRDNPTDRQRLAAVRHTELRKAAAILGVTHLYALGYHDSGMQGWETNTEPHAFAQARVEELTALAVVDGFDTFVLWSDGPGDLARFAEEVVPAVRAQVARERGR